MISPDDKIHLMYISDAIDEVNSYVQYEDFEVFVKDEIAKEAVVRQLQNIGGASKLLTDDFKMTYGDVDWDTLIRLEDAMYDQAEETSLRALWGIIKTDFPALRTQVSDLTATLSDLENEME
jgi:uncharacterized protein with HEPN domain